MSTYANFGTSPLPYIREWTFSVPFDSNFTDTAGRTWNYINSSAHGSIDNSTYKIGSGSYYNTSLSSAGVYYEDNSFVLGTGDFTMDCWYYSTSTTQSDGEIFDYRRDGFNERGITFMVTGTTFGLWNAIDGYFVTVSNAIPLNTWTRLTVTRQSGTLRTFVNGILQSTGAYSHSFDSPRFNIGSRYALFSGTGNYISALGYIDNFRIKKGTAYYTVNFDPIAQ